VNSSGKPYHHGDLRRVLLEAAVEAVAERGAAALSLRDLARRVGVSHAAPTHHFRDKAGLLTAVAVEGFARLGAALAEARDFADAGVAYVMFAMAQPGYFAVMFRPELYHRDDPEVAAARARTTEMLRAGARQAFADDDRLPALAAWSLVHGMATLIIDHALELDPGTDVAALARAAALRLR
jgi:AcrR family transcriptional regulator